MTEDLRARQRREFDRLFSLIKEVLKPYGREWDFKLDEGEYWLRDDNLMRFQHSLEIQNLDLLKPVVIKSLQKVLADYPDWEIVVSVDIPDKKGVWPPMGLIVSEDEVIDELERKYFPKEFQDIQYEGSRPPRSLFR